MLPVAAAIYQNGEEKSAMNWSFEMEIGSEGDKKLFDFIIRLREGFGIGDAANWKHQNLKLRERLSSFSNNNELSKGQIIWDRFDEEQWDAAIAKVITKGRALIGRLSKSG